MPAAPIDGATAPWLRGAGCRDWLPRSDIRTVASARKSPRARGSQSPPRCLRMALTDCGSIARFETVPQRPIDRNTLPLSIFAATIQAFSALHRPAGQINDLVLFTGGRFGATEMDGERGKGGASGISMGGSTVSCSHRSPAISLRRRPPDANATIGIARSRRSRRLSVAQVASSFSSTSDVTAFTLLRRRVRGTARQADCGLEGRGGKGAVETPPFRRRRPVRQPPHRARRVRADGFQESLPAQVFVDVVRHTVIGIGLATLRVPQVMGDELEQQGFGRRPGQRSSGRCQSPGFEIGEVRGPVWLLLTDFN